MNKESLSAITAEAVLTVFRFHDNNIRHLEQEYPRIIHDHVQSVWPLRSKAQCLDVAHLEIAGDVAVTCAEEFNRRRPEHPINRRWVYMCVQNLLAIQLTPALLHDDTVERLMGSSTTGKDKGKESRRRRHAVAVVVVPQHEVGVDGQGGRERHGPTNSHDSSGNSSSKSPTSSWSLSTSTMLSQQDDGDDDYEGPSQESKSSSPMRAPAGNSAHDDDDDDGDGDGEHGGDEDDWVMSQDDQDENPSSKAAAVFLPKKLQLQQQQEDKNLLSTKRKPDASVIAPVPRKDPKTPWTEEDVKLMVELKDLCGLTHDQVATQLGRGKGSVENKYGRVVKEAKWKRYAQDCRMRAGRRRGGPKNLGMQSRAHDEQDDDENDDDDDDDDDDEMVLQPSRKKLRFQ